MALDDILKGISHLNEGLKSNAINTSLQDANAKLADINSQFNEQLNQGVSQRKAQEQFLSQKMGLAQQLAGSLLGFGANAADVQQATQFLSPNAQQTIQNDQFQQRQDLDVQQFKQNKIQFEADLGLRRKQLEFAQNQLKQAEVDTSFMSPTYRKIVQRVPKEQQDDAVKELGEFQATEAAIDAFRLEKDANGNITGSPEALAKFDELRALAGAEGGYLSQAAKVKLQAFGIEVSTIMRKSIKGPVDVKEQETIIDPFMAGRIDSDEALFEKIMGVRNYIEKQRQPTPNLTGVGINPYEDLAVGVGPHALGALDLVKNLPSNHPKFKTAAKAVEMDLRNQELQRTMMQEMKSIKLLKPSQPKPAAATKQVSEPAKKEKSEILKFILDGGPRFGR
jgi:hypothetical protein